MTSGTVLTGQPWYCGQSTAARVVDNGLRFTEFQKLAMGQTH